MRVGTGLLERAGVSVASPWTWCVRKMASGPGQVQAGQVERWGAESGGFLAAIQGRGDEVRPGHPVGVGRVKRSGS